MYPTAAAAAGVQHYKLRTCDDVTLCTAAAAVRTNKAFV